MSERNDAQKSLGICGVVALIDGGFLYLKRTRGTSTGGCFNIPGGKLEPGETPIKAALREFKEETGISIGERKPTKACEFDSYAITRDDRRRELWVTTFVPARRCITLDSVVLKPSEHKGKRTFRINELRGLRKNGATQYIDRNISDFNEVVSTPADSKLPKDYFWIFEKAASG